MPVDKNSFEYKLDEELTSLFKEPEMVAYAKPSRKVTYSCFVR